MVEKITPRSEEYARWYTDVIREAELADYAPVRGCMVIRPYGYALWENIQAALDRRFKETGHQNAYFPLFIPMSFIEKEAEHVAGFAPELAVVTHGGGKVLEEPLVVRPTSETVIGHMYARWVRSYRDLPLLINQWCNVVRWELRTRPFLRTLEFLWQEGHTAHATEEEAKEETLRMLEVYRDFAETEAAVPVIAGRKSESEKFAGGVTSYTIEAMMGNRWALQAGTSHFLGQNFARAFEIKYLDQDNELQYCWTTSWGLSTRFVGAVIMVHGDDRGLRMPPRLAPIQAVIVPIWRNEEEKETVLAALGPIEAELRPQVRLEVDAREEYTPGWKFNEWEMKGVPLRIEVGPMDVERGQVVLVRRDTGQKSSAPQEGLVRRVRDMLGEIQATLFAQARAFMEEHSFAIEEYDEFKAVVEGEGGFVWACWCGSADCEAAIKEDTKATIRCIPCDQDEGDGRCIYCGGAAREKAVFAKAY